MDHKIPLRRQFRHVTILQDYQILIPSDLVVEYQAIDSIDVIYGCSGTQTSFKRHAETGNQGLNCFYSLKSIALPLHPMECGLFHIVISARRDADFPMIPHENTVFARGCKPTSLGIIPCQITAKASAPQTPGGVP